MSDGGGGGNEWGICSLQTEAEVQTLLFAQQGHHHFKGTPSPSYKAGDHPQVLPALQPWLLVSSNLYSSCSAALEAGRRSISFTVVGVGVEAWLMGGWGVCVHASWPESGVRAGVREEGLFSFSKGTS